MTRETFRALLRALVAEALRNGWHSSDVQGELVIAEMELDERVPARSLEENEPPF